MKTLLECPHCHEQITVRVSVVDPAQMAAAGRARMGKLSPRERARLGAQGAAARGKVHPADLEIVCSYCGGAVGANAITATREGIERAWHPDCYAKETAAAAGRPGILSRMRAHLESGRPVQCSKCPGSCPASCRCACHARAA